MHTPLLKGIFVAVSLLLALRGLAIADDNHGCSNRSLKGNYAFTAIGETPNPDGTATFGNTIGMTHFDGMGNLTQVDFPSIGGFEPLTDFRTGQTGTYTVHSDCTCRMQILLNVSVPQGSSGVLNIMCVLSNHGRAVHLVVSEGTLPGQPEPSRGASTRAVFRKLGSVHNDK